jgi:hypothetical protein
MKSDNKLLPHILQDLGIDQPAPEVRTQLIKEFGQEAFSKTIQTIRQTAVPPLKQNVQRILENRGDKLTDKFCDDLIDELTDAMEVVYLKKDDLAQ